MQKITVMVMRIIVFFLFPMAQKPNSGLGNLSVDIYRSHTIRHIHMVRFLCTREQPVAESPINTTHNKHKKVISMTSAGFEPEIPAIKRPQIYALDLTATGIDLILVR